MDRGLGMLAAAAIGAAATTPGSDARQRRPAATPGGDARRRRPAATPGNVAADMAHRLPTALRLEHPSGWVGVTPAPRSGHPPALDRVRTGTT
ncbi:hypothetical protein [Actinoplanes missouriensis]|uniref:hypothetical protein n=1 Tax=Actinoplanes missouriensis TaxID=1866 RepID=UPI0012FBC892|nr:hypothetical protein [Actinoplanes missouriensis]